jgi:hypothetical protein
MSTTEQQRFADYLVDQSAIGNCRMSQFLTTLANTLEKSIQKTKDDGRTPDVKNIETLRFVEWLMRRPVDVQNKTSLPLWLLRYPYVEGPQKAGNLPLSAKYANFKATTSDEKLLSSIFAATNDENVRIMTNGYNKNFTEAKLF